MKSTLLTFVIGFGVALAVVRFVTAQTEPKKQAAGQKKSESTAPAQKPNAPDAQKTTGAEQKKSATPATKSAAPAVDRSADEQAIRTNVEGFVKAYNAGDAKAAAAFFAPDGQVITEDGDTIEGREAIEQGFNEIFDESPETQMEVTVESIRFIGSDIAMEVGSTKETAAPGETPDYGRYTVLHVKRDGKWLMAAARDAEGDPPTAHERLLPLAWLLGEWIDDGGSTVVRTNCHWADHENYLLQEMNLQVDGKDAMQVTQRIGWDPMSKRIRSWVFDTEGGFSEGVWTRDGDSWIVKTTGVRPDGAAASATSVIVPAGKDGFVWRMTDRIIGDDVEEPLEVKVVRKPPVPVAAPKSK